MKIYLNQTPIFLNHSISLKDMLDQHRLTGNYFAVAVNKTFVSRMQYENYFLKDNDEIDVVQPMQGG
jgi:sulfur carrier protein